MNCKLRGKRLVLRKIQELRDMYKYVFETSTFRDYNDIPYHMVLVPLYGERQHYEHAYAQYAHECEACSINLTIRYLLALSSGQSVGSRSLEHFRRWLLPEEYKTLKVCYKGKFS